MQFVQSKLGVRLIHECVLYTRRYGKHGAFPFTLTVFVRHKGDADDPSRDDNGRAHQR